MIQKKFEMIGRYGCYFLCLLHYAGDDYSNTLRYYDYFTKKGWMGDDCFIKNPVAILRYLTGDEWTVEISDTLKSADLTIEYWYNPATKLHHFVHRQADGKLWDPLGSSITVRDGHVESYRLFRRR